MTDAPAYQFLVRLYVDKRFLKHTLREWGVLAPVIFMGLQALQVIIAPIPGEIPGLPKDMTCYLFGLSPMPFWVFAVVSTLGRVPGTWLLSAQGARTESGDYLQVILLTAVAVAVALPLYYYRNRVIEWFRGKQPDVG